MFDPVEFGKRVREFRTRLGMSLTDLTMKTGMSAPYLSELERGQKGSPTAQTLDKLADALGVSVDELMGRKEPHSVDFDFLPGDVIAYLRRNPKAAAIARSLAEKGGKLLDAEFAARELVGSFMRRGRSPLTFVDAIVMIEQIQAIQEEQEKKRREQD